jgi:hypothetical protein
MPALPVCTGPGGFSVALPIPERLDATAFKVEDPLTRFPRVGPQGNAEGRMKKAECKAEIRRNARTCGGPTLGWIIQPFGIGCACDSATRGLTGGGTDSHSAVWPICPRPGVGLTHSARNDQRLKSNASELCVREGERSREPHCRGIFGLAGTLALPGYSGSRAMGYREARWSSGYREHWHPCRRAKKTNAPARMPALPAQPISRISL